MARRGRGAATRAQVESNGRPKASNGLREYSADDEADEPGARTIGAMALQRWAARDPGTEAGSTGVPTARTSGPYDVDDVDPAQAAVERVDFGAVLLPIPPGGEVTVEPEEGRLQAVHVMLPAGRLSVSALAAPRTERLWPDLAREIDESLRDGGATVRSFTGEWGRELHARTGEASSVFVGVDGPRWLLYGVATGPTGVAAELDTALRRMLRSAVVVRGRAPYPVRTVLPLTVPEHLADVPSAFGQFGVGASDVGASVSGTGASAQLGETALVPPVPPAAPDPVDRPTGFVPAAGDDASTAPRGLPRVPPARVDTGHGRGGPGGHVPGRAANVEAAPRNGSARNGSSRNGVSSNGAARNGAWGNGASQVGAAQNGAWGNGASSDAGGSNGAGWNGAGWNGAGSTSGGRNGAVRGQPEHGDAARDRPPATGAPDAGSARTSRMPARPPQRRVADLLAEAEAERERAAAARAAAPEPPAPPWRPATPPRSSSPAADVGPAQPAPVDDARAGWRPAADRSAPWADTGYPAAEAVRPQPDDRYDTPLYFGGLAPDDDDRTAIGDVPLYDDVARSTAARDRVPSPTELPPREPRWAGPPSDGSDDWTVPIPVVRPEPEPEPPRGRRTRRRYETRSEAPWTSDPGAGDPWTGRRRTDEPDRHAQGRHGARSADRPTRPAERHAAPRYPARDRAAEEPDTRFGPAHARPADRWSEPRGRHHRPGE